MLVISVLFSLIIMVEHSFNFFLEKNFIDGFPCISDIVFKFGECCFEVNVFSCLDAAL